MFIYYNIEMKIIGNKIKIKADMIKEETASIENTKINTRHLAAIKAWETIRKKRLERIIKENRSLEFYKFYKDMRNVSYGSYRINPPLIKPSKLTFKDKGGVGKELSDGYALNFAIGCTHACRFCYVDSIHKRFTLPRLNTDIIAKSWGMYLLIPENIEEAIALTPWHKWKGKEVMLSSTHDPYLPELAGIARRILEVSLPTGVRYCIQTRSLLVRNDFDLLTKYKEQVRLQVSIATLDKELASIIEPRVALPDARLRLLREAKSKGLKVGVIIAPIFPVKGWLNDLEDIFKELASIGVDNVYGEILHVRGSNLEYLKEVGLLNDDLNNNKKKKNELLRFDRLVGKHFNAFMHRYNMKGEYWYEHYCYSSTPTTTFTSPTTTAGC